MASVRAVRAEKRRQVRKALRDRVIGVLAAAGVPERLLTGFDGVEASRSPVNINIPPMHDGIDYTARIRAALAAEGIESRIYWRWVLVPIVYPPEVA